MRLAELLATMGPYLVGRAPHAQTAQKLLNEVADGPGSERLRIYGEFCRQHRFDAVDHVFAHCRATVVAHAGDSAWEELIERYFQAHPMHHFELNWNGRHLPAFLAERQSGSLDPLPPFLPDLADFEWWEWQTYVAPDEAADEAADKGPLRVASTVELRPYRYDLPGWIETRDTHRFRTSPEAVPSVVLFWRDADRDLRRAAACPLEMRILKAVIEATAIDEDFAVQLGLPADSVAACLRDLHAAGVLRGAMRSSLSSTPAT